MSKSFSLKKLQAIYEDEGKKEAKKYFDNHIFITTSVKIYVLIDGKLKCYTREQVEFLFINRMPKSLQKYFLTTTNIYRIVRDKTKPQIGEDFINLLAKKETEEKEEEENPSKLEKFIKKGKGQPKEKEIEIETEDWKTAHNDFLLDFE